MAPRRRSAQARSPSPQRSRSTVGSSSGRATAGPPKAGLSAEAVLSSITVHGYMTGSTLFLAGILAAEFGSEAHQALCADYRVTLLGTVAYFAGSLASLVAHHAQ
eukprot:COSAG06_NODE_2395_length_6958_cov_4.127132_3_plen_105_part_00